MLKFVVKLINISFALLLFLIIAGLIIIYEYTKNLPSYEQIINYKPDLSVNIYDNDGNYLTSLFKENRIMLSYENTPALIKQAIISAEDKDFYSNSGIDFNGIFRSLFSNIFNYVGGGNKLTGGSTITQQIIKNIVLSPEKTLRRKIQEVRLALGITKHLTKEEILERYINHIYLGNNRYGFATAALGYFNKPIDDLKIEEAAMLAALPQAPSRYDPTKRENLDALYGRRNWIIHQMHKLGYITEEQMEEAQKQPITISKKLNVTQKPLGIEYVVDEIKRKLVNLCADDESLIYQYGFNVYSTINPELQEMATYSLRKGLFEYEKLHYAWKGPIDHFKTETEYLRFLKSFNYTEVYPLKTAFITKKANGKMEAMLNADQDIIINESTGKFAGSVKVGDVVLVFADKNLDKKKDSSKKDEIVYRLYQEPRINGAIVAIDTHTGNVLAMSGGYNYYKNQFNRATQALRQPGSAFKMLVYLTGLEKGMTPNSIVMDEPISMPMGSGKWWSPKNADGQFFGAMTMQTALMRSRNLCTLYIARMVGLKNIVETAKKLSLFPQDYSAYNYSLVLGSQEVTLIDLVRVYGIIANGGFNIKTNVIEYIKDNAGKTLWRRSDDECIGCDLQSSANNISLGSDLTNPIPPLVKETKERLVSEKANYDMVQMLKGVVTGGTARSLAYLGGHMAGKTGTSNEAKDVWFIGMTKRIAFGIFVGFDQPKSLGARAYGTTVAIPIIKYFLDAASSRGLLMQHDPFYGKGQEARLDRNSVDDYYADHNEREKEDEDAQEKKEEIVQIPSADNKGPDETSAVSQALPKELKKPNPKSNTDYEVEYGDDWYD